MISVLIDDPEQVAAECELRLFEFVMERMFSNVTVINQREQSSC